MTRLTAAFAAPHPALVCFLTAGDGDTTALRHCEEPQATRQSIDRHLEFVMPVDGLLSYARNDE